MDWGGVAVGCTLPGSLMDWGFGSAYTRGRRQGRQSSEGVEGTVEMRGGGRWARKELGDVNKSDVEVAGRGKMASWGFPMPCG